MAYQQFWPQNLEVSYNSVINACAQTGYVERAEMWREGSADGTSFHRTASLAVEKKRRLGRMLEAGVQANEAWKFFAREKTYCFFFWSFQCVEPVGCFF